MSNFRTEFEVCITQNLEGIRELHEQLQRIQRGLDEQQPEAVHPVQSIFAAIHNQLFIARTALESSVLLLSSWEEIKDMCDDSAADAAENETRGARPYASPADPGGILPVPSFPPDDVVF